MPAPIPAPVRTGRDPAVAVWVLAGACWTLTAGLVLAGIGGGCHDAVAPVGATRRLSVPAATAFAAWLVMAGAMMLPTVAPLVRLFVPLTAHVPHPVATRLAFLCGYLAIWSGFGLLLLAVGVFG